MNTIDEMIEVLQHKKNGGEVEFFYHTATWMDAKKPVWNFQRYKYRPKPEPIECWINVSIHNIKTLCEDEEEADNYNGRTVFMREVEK